MLLRYTVPTLAALSALPLVSALEIADSDVKIDLGMRLQSRVEFADASDAAGDDFDIYEGVTTEDPKDYNFYLRRVRFTAKGSYKEDTRFNLTFSSDNIGQTPSTASAVAVRYAWVAQDFKSGDITHTLQFGLDKPKLVAGHYDSSSGHLFPSGRATTHDVEVDRRIGLEYGLAAPILNAWLGIYEKDAANDDDRNDMQLSIRAETSLSEEWKTKRAESYLAKEGFHHVLGAGIGIVTDNGEDEDGATLLTIDYSAHWNALSALLDFVIVQPEEDGVGDEMTISAQAGWAIPMDSGLVVEPAVRLAMIDNDDDNDDESDEYEDEGGAAGTYLDAGVNLYFNKHNNKMQVAITSFTPEDGDADAFVFRIAHQLNF